MLRQLRRPAALWLSSCLTHGLAQTPHWVKAITNGTHEWSAFDAWFSGALDGAHSRSWIDCNSYKCDGVVPVNQSASTRARMRSEAYATLN